jgi:hypothetical protein
VSMPLVRSKKLVSTSLKTSLFPILISSMEEEELLTNMFDPSILSKDILGIEWGPWYIKPRSLHWWDLFYRKVMNDDPIRFRAFFRVSPRTFNFLCTILNDDLVRNPPYAFEVGIRGRKLDVAKQVGISLRRLATSDTILTIGELFGVSITTVSRTIRRFINAMMLRASYFIKWPNGEDLNLVKMKFERLRGIPQVCGVIDCTHVEVELPGRSRATDYFDKDKDYSYVVQAIVDTDMRFLDVFAGFPGVVHDLRVLRNSGFFQLVEGGNRLNGQK